MEPPIGDGEYDGQRKDKDGAEWIWDGQSWGLPRIVRGPMRFDQGSEDGDLDR